MARNPLIALPLLLVVLTLPASPSRVERGQPQAEDPPPGLILLKGGKTKIGTPVKVIEGFALLDDQGRLLPNTACETPQHSVKVDEFFLMVTEVTNEQYAAFVRASGYKPPRHWGQAAINAVQASFLEEQGRLREEARDNGQQVPERKEFDKQMWWQQNWEGCEWAIPAGLDTHPVVYVDFQDIRAYCRWAGLRPMTEFEYQHACRGSSDHIYPWGDEWEVGRTANIETSRNNLFPVASYPQGAVGGFFDLAGNAWEWTSSQYKPYPGFKDLVVKSGKGAGKKKELKTEVLWNADQRVVVSGSFQSSGRVQRCTTRRPTDRSQSTEGVGFRCAGSLHPGMDVGQAILDQDLPVDVRPEGVVYDATLTAAADRWTSSEGTAKIREGDGAGPVPGYGVIESYEYVLFLPRDQIEAGVSIKNLSDASLREGPIHIGVFCTTRPTDVPALPAGTYMIAYRGAGEDRALGEVLDEGGGAGGEGGGQEGGGEGGEPVKGGQAPATKGQEEAAAIQYPKGMDILVANFLIYNKAGELISFIPVEHVEYDKAVPGQVLITDSTKAVVTLDDEGEEVISVVETTLARLKLCVPTPGGRKGFIFYMPVMYAKGEIDKSWRRR